MKNIIFFGPPGAGKGTQAKLISSYFNLPHLSTGDILRAKIQQKDQLGLELKNILASGKLVSDDILNSIVAEKIQKDCKNGFLLDGYPRTLDQSYFLENFLNTQFLKIDYIFNINIEFETLQKRILKRSKEENRDDDNLDVIKTRYSLYVDTTKKVSDHFQDKFPDNFYNIDGSDQIDKITSKIKRILEIS